MIRVCHLVRQYHPNIGGLESFVAGLAQALRARNYVSTVITLDRVFTAPRRKLAPLEEIGGVEVRRIPFIGHRRYFAPQLPGHMLASYDVVHVHGFDGLFEAVARSPRPQGQARVATSHGLFFHTPWMKTVKQIYLASVTKAAARAYDRLIANSQSDAAHMAPLGRPTVLIPNGVAALGPQLSNGRDLLALGRLASHKRIDRIIDALTDPSLSDVRLHVVGADWDVDQASLSEHARKRGVADRTILHGPLDAPSLQCVVAQCGVFVSASTYEGFGMSLIEAMSVGLIPVVHPNASFAELMSAAPAGATAAFDNPAVAASAIRRELDHLSPERQRLVAEYASRFSWDAHAEQTARLYNQVLGDAHARRCA